MPSDLLVIGYILVTLVFAIFLRAVIFDDQDDMPVILIIAITGFMTLPLYLSAIIVEVSARLIKGEPLK